MVTIKNGKFYKDGQEMPVEFGNLEQIQALDYIEKHTAALKEGLMLDPDTETVVTFRDHFNCFCGQLIFLEDSSENEDDVQVLAGKVLKCACKKHQFKTYMEDGCLMVKKTP
ncbi:hypothetical protein [Pedobacter gandavensis]|uniref:Rieske domain-containing protein n=1 Tax=Pedobacter gandavensis TaxID=2679963 RepID=A0ABR6EU85_9SPHI|nr:hypothetical protein [Pedobacter gandavensis]MBB2148832.1 hypothetical protein [Pedobacter gandavensis]